MHRFLITAAIAALAACSGPSNRLDSAPRTSDLSLRATVGSAMVRVVSLPTYAAGEEIAVEVAPGVIGTNEQLLWADQPERAVTLTIAQQLDDILSATVGPEPWPFGGLPDVAVDVRVTQMLAGIDGVFRLSGQYYIGGDGIDFRESSHGFAFAVPMTDTTAAALAAAQATAILQLSEDIAGRLGR